MRWAAPRWFRQSPAVANPDPVGWASCRDPHVRAKAAARQRFLWCILWNGLPRPGTMLRLGPVDPVESRGGQRNRAAPGSGPPCRAPVPSYPASPPPPPARAPGIRPRWPPTPPAARRAGCPPAAHEGRGRRSAGPAGQFAPERRRDIVEHPRPDDAARPPDLGDAGHVQRPDVMIRRRRQ